MTNINNIIEQLSQRSDPFDYELLQEKFWYLSIDKTIKKMNDVVGVNWSQEVTVGEVFETGKKTKNGALEYGCEAHVKVSICVDGIWYSRDGVGGAFTYDRFNVLKNAQADAFKKACNQWGVASELWNPAFRQYLNHLRGWQNFKVGTQPLLNKITHAAQKWNESESMGYNENDRALLEHFLKAAGLSEEEKQGMRDHMKGKKAEENIVPEDAVQEETTEQQPPAPVKAKKAPAKKEEPKKPRNAVEAQDAVDYEAEMAKIDNVEWQ